jgi:hypothetical protein
MIMKTRQLSARASTWFLIALLVAPPAAVTQQTATAPSIKQEELDQILAPIALYPDALVAQILMASTYPLEVVQADRFAKQNTKLNGDALTKALEAQTWDPSVKSLVNFPQVLTMMSEKLDWTQKLGDAFLTEQKQVMDTIQSLRAKAQAAGNLKTTKEQTVIVEQKIIKIEPATAQVIYVPAYNPTVVYGVWAYPAYPPYYYYPPGYVATATAFSFATGVAMGAAWGYAWGDCDYHGGNVKYNYNQNININNNINRNVYAKQMPANAQGNWQHNAANRKGVPYNSQQLQQRYNQASPSQKVDARQAYRGHTGSALTPQEQQQAQARAQQAQQQQKTQQAQQQQRVAQAQQTQQARGGEQSRASEAGVSQFGSGGAFEGVERGGSSARASSQRGQASRGGGGRGGRR